MPNAIPAASAPYLDNIPAQVNHLVIALSQRNHAQFQGLMPWPEIDGLMSDLRCGSDLSVVYDQARSVIFRYVPGT